MGRALRIRRARGQRAEANDARGIPYRVQYHQMHASHVALGTLAAVTAQSNPAFNLAGIL